jgi:hypothetical protein
MDDGKLTFSEIKIFFILERKQGHIRKPYYLNDFVHDINNIFYLDLLLKWQIETTITK